MNYGKFYIQITPACNPGIDHAKDTCCTVYKQKQSGMPEQAKIGQFTITTNEIGDYGSLEDAIIGHLQRDYPDNNPQHEKCYRKIQKLQEHLQTEQKALIVDLLKRKGGCVTSHPMPDEEGNVEYPITMTFYGEHNNPNISITNVYLNEHGEIYVDGIDESTGTVERGFQVYPEHRAWVLSFLSIALGFKRTKEKQ